MSVVRVCPACGAEYITSVDECVECYVPLLEPGEEPDGDEVVYELDDWEPELLDKLSAALHRERIAHRWEENRNLVVDESWADRVDELLDEVEFPDALDEDAEPAPGEGHYDTLSDLFVAADRLLHDPGDPGLGADMVDAAAAVAASGAPYGVPKEEWNRIKGIALDVRRAVEDEADDDVIAADARNLRDILRRFV